jgi:hypothetical protein
VHFSPASELRRRLHGRVPDRIRSDRQLRAVSGTFGLFFGLFDWDARDMSLYERVGRGRPEPWCGPHRGSALYSGIVISLGQSGSAGHDACVRRGRRRRGDLCVAGRNVKI